MRKALRLIPIIISLVLFMLCGCTVPGEIGDVETFFDDNLVLKDYEENDDGGFSETDSKQKDQELDVLVGDYMESSSYSSVGLKFKGSQNSKAVITTMTFELEFSSDCAFNLAVYADNENLYESGIRSYVGQQSYSFVVSELAYSASTSRLYFKNEPASDKTDEVYTGYSAQWKIKYLQIIYEGR